MPSFYKKKIEILKDKIVFPNQILSERIGANIYLATPTKAHFPKLH